MLEVLRCLRALDVVLQQWCRKDLEKLDPEVRVVLRLGLVEVMRLDVPPALATDGAVRLARRLGRSSAAGMVNAILRKAAAGWPEILESSSIDIRLSHPGWLYQRWLENFDSGPAKESMAASQEGAVTWVWFLDDDGRRALAADGVELEAHPWMPDCWTAPGKAADLVQVVAARRAYAQDPSSQLVAHIAGSLTGTAGRVIDLCAAPGGKSALMAKNDLGTLRVAADVSPQRVRMMARTLESWAGQSVVVADAMQPPFAPESWDLVLLDAPCSGSGTFRRHPELKWRLRPESVQEMAVKQRALFESALGLVAPGGVLLYSTCSVEPEENEGVVSRLSEGFAIENLSAAMPEGAPWIPTPTGGCRILPNPDGDGFTMHAVRRS